MVAAAFLAVTAYHERHQSDQKGALKPTTIA